MREVQDRLREVQHGPRLERVVERMETIRNHRVGHADEDRHFDEEARREAAVTLGELEELWRRLGEFYHALNFGAQQMFVTIELYAGDDGTGGDLGYLLQLVAENGNVVACFDENPEVWRSSSRRSCLRTIYARSIEFVNGSIWNRLPSRSRPLTNSAPRSAWWISGTSGTLWRMPLKAGNS